MLEEIYYQVDERAKIAVKIGSKVRKILSDFLLERGFVEIPPVIISPITDPLAHPVFDGEINYYGNKYYLTKSMIFHKQLALLSLEKIFCFSPNIRLELKDLEKTGRHLAEFTQLDLEVRNASREDVMELAEDMLIHLFKKLREECKEELEILGREIKIPSKPFKRISFEEAYNKYGKDYEEMLSKEEKEPFWIIDFPKWKREFYDKEYEDRKGWLVDMDLIYPEGFGEALSGGEREYEYERIVRRMEEKSMNLQAFYAYLQIARIAKFYPSAGFGIGIERLIRYICGFEDIRYTTLFPKIPGKYCI